MVEVNIRYPEDVKRIVEAYEKKNIVLDDKTAQGLWYDYSDMVACGWCSGVSEISLDEIYEITKSYLPMRYAVVEIEGDDVYITNQKFYNRIDVEEFIKNNKFDGGHRFYKILNL